ncbi:hypothetical protein EYF80_030626 [Liparis tanakae]|uniref:Uncharacterized protein n=1 Tax=Liparis tanakae TaxID=230148 RepID=A0A4Z2H093_9TELE|nr:hypothetical protein EYF80_030626 [Liparis tanakae]
MVFQLHWHQKHKPIPVPCSPPTGIPPEEGTIEVSYKVPDRSAIAVSNNGVTQLGASGDRRERVGGRSQKETNGNSRSFAVSTVEVMESVFTE